MKTRTTYRTIEKIAAEARKMHAAGMTWKEIAIDLRVLTEDGRPDPGLAWRITNENYEPGTMATRRRLGLAPKCPTCYQYLPKPPRQIPRELEAAVQILATLEAAANPEPTGERRYSRRGKLVTKN